MKRILIIEDDRDIVELVRYNLANEGFQVSAAGDGATGLGAVKKNPPDLILLDLMLPKLSGLEVCKEIRREQALNRLPILMLTARGEEADRVIGLEMGADDYVTKPFSLEELVARVRAVLRRANGTDKSESGRLQFADLEMDEESHEVWRANDAIELTPTEFTLLRYLLLNAKRVLSKAQILDHVWHYDFAGDANVVETYISYLRKKVDKYDPPLIHTIRGVGYCLRLPKA